MAHLIDSILELVPQIGHLEEMKAELSEKLKGLECSGQVSGWSQIVEEKKESEKSETPPPTPSSASITQFNPMKFPEILELVLTYVGRQTLGPLRLVCKVWDTQAKAQMVKRTLFTLSMTNIARVSEFETLTKTSFHGFRNILVDLHECHTYHRHLERIDKILVESGHQIREFACRFYPNSGWRIQDFRDKYLAHLKNIEYLGLSAAPSNFYEMPSIFPPGSRQSFNSLRRIWIGRGFVPRSSEIGFWTDLFLSAPNLVKLDLSAKNVEGGLATTNFTDAIHVISELKPERLRILNIMSKVEETSVDKLILSDLELDSLRLYSLRSLDVEFSTSSAPQIHPLALNYGETYCVDMTKILMDLLAIEFTALQDSGTKVRCLGLLKTFQSKLDHLLVPRNP